MSDVCALNAHTPTLTVVDPRGLAVRSVSFHRTRADEPVTERVDRSSVDPARRLIRRWDPRLWASGGSEADARSNLCSLFSLTSQALLSESVDAGWEVALYGSGGERRCRWDTRAQLQRFEYDALLRPEAVFETDGLTERCTERLTYGSANDAFANQCGQLIRHDDPAGSLTNRVFSLTGEVTEQTRRFLKDLGVPDWPDVVAERDDLLEPGEGARSSWCFGPSGDALEQIDAMGNVQTFAHTVAGQLKSTVLQLRGQPLQTLVSDIDYDAQGRIQSETAGNDIVTALDYDPVDGRLIRLRADNGLVQDLNYAYDPVGNVLSIEDLAQPIRYFANQQVEPLRTFAYDTLYQLIEATGYEAKTMSRGPASDAFRTFAQADELGGYTQRYDYDAGGNLRTLVHVGAQNFTRRFATASTSNRSVLQTTDQPPSEEQIVASFDPTGNLLALQEGQDLAWDFRNQLSEVTPVERESGINDSEVYRYDAAGMRVRKVRITQTKTVAHHNEVRYLPGLEIRTNTATGEVLHVITATAGRSNVRVLHWQVGKPQSLENDQVRYSLSDHLGSSTLELDAEAQLISQEIYYPYGETAWFAGRNEVEVNYKTIRYSGKERDATGLYYYGLRYYAPWLMRWINPDPAGDVDGLNVYQFVRSSPLRFIDPSGAAPIEPPDYAEHAYELMFKNGRVWSGLSRGGESGFQTMARISKTNLFTLERELDTENQLKLAARISGIPPEQAWITHFSESDFSTEEGVHFKSLAMLQKERDDLTYEGHSEGGNLTEYANHDFVFFAMEAGGREPAKKSSRFGTYRYHASFSELRDKTAYTHMELTDLLRPNSREISEQRSSTLAWLRGFDATEAGVSNFRSRAGLSENTHADLLFLGGDMLKGIGHKIATELPSFSSDTQDAIVEWASDDRPLLNVGEIINAFYRPQVVVPGGLKIRRNYFSVTRSLAGTR